jgi:hypothetical protein
MRTALTSILYLTLAAVVYSCAASVWIALAEPARYAAAFPGAQGFLYDLTIALSGAATLNALAIGLRWRWAIWTNFAIGIGSIVLFEIARGPRVTEAIIAASCVITTGLPLLLWRQQTS